MNTKTNKTAIHTHLMAAIFVAALLLVGGEIEAQQYYVLTNGTSRLIEEGDNDKTTIDTTAPTTHIEPIGYMCVSNCDDPVNRRVSSNPKTYGLDYPNDTTILNKIGNYYVALEFDTADDGTVEPKVASTSTFSIRCVWARTSTRGYYFQKVGDTYYYLCMSSGGGVTVKPVGLGERLEGVSYWYDWDFGAAIEEVYVRDGWRQKEYYWLMHDGEEWVSSCNSYNRPETIIYTGGSAANRTYYCWKYSDETKTTRVPTGTAAQAGPVQVVEVGRDIKSMTAGKGLLGIEVTRDAETNPVLKWEEGEKSATVSLQSDMTGTVQVTLTRPHTEYHVEQLRLGMNLNYRKRGEEKVYSNGVAEYKVYYVYDDAPETILEAARADEVDNISLSDIDSVVYVLAKPLRRYVTIDGEESGVVTIYGSGSGKVGALSDPLAKTLTLTLRTVPNNTTDTLTATVYYHNGAVQSEKVGITLSSEVHFAERPRSGNAPKIGYRVVGGGRMASVHGDTRVDVHSCDTIGQVYGGNDVAGWVHGSATVNIGSDKTDEEHAVRVGSVYGGGCGLYTYEGLNFDDEHRASGSDTAYANGDTRIPHHSYYFNGKVYEWGISEEAYAEGLLVSDSTFDFVPKTCEGEIDLCEDGLGGTGTIPYVKNAHVTVGLTVEASDASRHNDYVWVDSVFGGAANSFIGVTATSEGLTNATTVTINGGTVYAVFGGNNYGGTVANTATAVVNIDGTKLTNKVDIENGPYTEYGREYGVRYVFGGGNLVENSHSEVNIHGGMVDTVFLGGNRASVVNPIGTVNCTGADFIYSNPGYISEFDSSVYQAKDGGPMKMYDWVTAAPKEWDQDHGHYNVRCLFGGNNQADMTTLSLINLVSGGVNTVYGGGNMGDMRADIDPSTVPTLRDELASIFGAASDKMDDGFPVPKKLSSVVRSSDTSRIIVESIYGGCRMADVLHSSGLHLAGGVFGYVHGGCDISGDVGSSAEDNAGAYTVLSNNVLVMQDAYGGSDGYYHCIDDNGYYKEQGLTNYLGELYDPYDELVGKAAPTLNNSHILMTGGTVMANIYGGAVLTDVGYADKRYDMVRDRFTNVVENGGSVHLTMTGGTVEMNVYGGGYMSSVHGLGYIHVGGTAEILGDLYAGNDYTGNIESFVAFDESMKDSRGKVLNYVETESGEGNLQSLFASYLRIDGTPKIKNVYGSGNGAYNYYGDRPWYDMWDICMSTDGDILLPEQSSTLIDINTQGGYIDTVFGGGNGVGVKDGKDVTVVLNIDEAVGLTNSSDGLAVGSIGNAVNSSDHNGRYVGTIFGGNNRDAMASTPTIELIRGTVGDVYGGGNHGDMTYTDAKREDGCGNDVTGVSTYIKVESANAIVTGSIYGGCNMGDVSGMALIVVKETNDDGIHSIYGGNNIAGTVKGNTRIDMVGGVVDSIYGGSNGHYDYIERTDGYAIYPYGSVSEKDTTGKLIATFSTGAPLVSNTQVNIYGGTVKQNIFGGGRMGDCDSTHVVINNTACGGSEAALTLNGTVFGGGEGNWRDLNAERRGTVRERCYVDLFHATDVAEAKAYGGGRGGDVNNTWITIHEDWDKPLDELYGGCWGSDVIGTTHVRLDGRNDMAVANVGNVFGGNDFTGNVYKTNVTVNKGLYGNIYGGGNGDYPDNYYTDYFPIEGESNNHVYSGSKRIYRPNNEYGEVTLTSDEVSVDGSVYGGGLLGTTFPYQKNEHREYVLVDGKKVADTTRTYAQAVADSVDNYSYSIVNIRGGKIANNVFAGGAGAPDYGQIVYGVKVLNMDGGTVGESIYGGSENVDDGYRHEWTASEKNDMTGMPYDVNGDGEIGTDIEHSTLRPSSVINITGGIVQKHVFGAGYMGNVYGSTYLNIGASAVDDCPLWSKQVDSKENSYAAFKPGAGGHSPSLERNSLLLNMSVYGGANWGSNEGGARFDVQGYYGGESRIYIDGEGYKTDEDGLNQDPEMLIVRSIIGSGTSAEGGDIVNYVRVKNYGKLIAPEDCSDYGATRRLESVQRIDTLWMQNTAIRYSGATDASSSYVSDAYSWNKIGVVNMCGYNVEEFDVKADNIGELYFRKDDCYTLTTRTEMYELVQSQGNCDENNTWCDRVAMVDPDDVDRRYSVLVMNKGIAMNVAKSNGNVVTYGNVYGYGYLTAADGVSAMVSANWYANGVSGSAYGGEGIGANGSGFIASCESDNKVASFSGDNVSWGTGAGNPEYEYHNWQGVYRTWRVGNGTRMRSTTILAHSDPKLLEECNRTLLVDGVQDDERFSLAKATLVLPHSGEGHYYKLSAMSFFLEGESDKLELVDKAWAPADGVELSDLPNDVWNTDVSDRGEWETSSLTALESMKDETMIMDNPNNTFGLVMVPGQNFKSSGSGWVMPATEAAAQSRVVISGNPYVNSSSYYCSPVVDGENSLPTMDLYMTYSNDFGSTFLGKVTFVLEEYDETGVSVGEPIEVTAQISTILEEFKNIEVEVLAMYNEGRTDKFMRKVMLPATLQQRDLYVTSVQWYPTDGTGKQTESTLFSLTDAPEVITEAAEGVHDRFKLSITPSQDVSDELTTSVGWHHIDVESQDLYSLVPSITLGDTLRASNHGAAVEIANAETRGMKIGTLDGRGLAAMVVELNFDGSRMYERIANKGYVGAAKIGMRSYHGDAKMESEPFYLTVYVKTREKGDTIYVSSKDEVSYTDSETGCTYTHQGIPNIYALPSDVDQSEVGKRPKWYVHSLVDALSTPYPYTEGDVIAIIDEVELSKSTIMHGADLTPIPVIRYTGDHPDLPGEACAYRGPMITVPDGLKLTADCIAFVGNAASRKYTVKGGTGEDRCEADEKVGDTLMAYGPVIAIKDGGQVLLSGGTSVTNNMNGYDGADNSLRGAISVTDGGTLTLNSDVTIAYNGNHDYKGEVGHEYKDNGAVYIDGGNLELGSTAIEIKNNYLIEDGEQWWVDTIAERYSIATDVMENWKKANVLLMRKAATGAGVDPVMRDSQSDVITLTGLIDRTTIGISKWFPGETVRDTIRAARRVKGLSSTILEAAEANGVFFSDDDEQTFYSPRVSSSYIYLHRCATFKQQVEGEDVIAGLAGRNPLEYKWDEMATCPRGGDTILYSVQGGFYPYTFSWSGETEAENNTMLSNITMDALVQGGNVDVVRAANTDAMPVPVVDMGYYATSETLNWTVTARDEAGCEQTKDVTIYIKKVDENSVSEPFEIVNGTDDAWTKRTVKAADGIAWENLTAEANRNYHAIHVEPRIWVDRNAGTVTATLSGDNRVYSIDPVDSTEYDLTAINFCEGDVILLRTESKKHDEATDPANPGNPDDYEFIMWDFDPFYTPEALYVVPAKSSTVTAYYGPKDYWKDVINTPEKATVGLPDGYYYTRPDGAGYATTYNGDVHIYSEEGLAWLISVVNGLNGMQARQFYFNRVYLHQKADGTAYDMKAHLWTPVGTHNQPFRGRIIGVSSDDTTTVPLVDERVEIRNIIVNEPGMSYAGLFGSIDTAHIEGLELQMAMVRGAQYVGAVAAEAVNAKISNVSVTDSSERNNTTIITTHHTSGGIVGKATGTKIENTSSMAKYVGDAVYSGGIIGYGDLDTVKDSYAYNDNRMSGVYMGGVAGRITSSSVQQPNMIGRLMGRKATGDRSYIANNYVRMASTTDGRTVGGIAGMVDNTVMENNYVYGMVSASANGGSVAGQMGEGAEANGNFAAYKTATATVGLMDGGSMGETAEFSGSGNSVKLDHSVAGVDNLTRVLNKWVRYQNARGGSYKTWRSDLEKANGGYPVFGEPDMIPVTVDSVVYGCEVVYWNGQYYADGDSVSDRVIDYEEMIDSVSTVHFVVRHGSVTEVADSCTAGEAYDGNGFHISATETALLAEAARESGMATITLSDTLTTMYGCDSIVNLTIALRMADIDTTTGDTVVVVDTDSTLAPEIKLYPNPTTSRFTVEAKKMSHVEVYDSEGRKQDEYDVDSDMGYITIDISRYASGIYYVRVFTPGRTDIQKIIKK